MDKSIDMQPHDHLDQFSFHYQAKIQQSLGALQKYFRINHLVYYTLSAQGDWTVLSANPHFAQNYIANELYQFDALLRHPDNYSEGLLLWSSLQEKCQENLVTPFKSKFDMHHGFTLITNSADPRYRLSGFSFTVPENDSVAFNSCLNEMPLIVKFCEYFKQEHAAILCRLHDFPLNLIGLVGSQKFSRIEPTIPWLTPRARHEFSQEFVWGENMGIRNNFANLSAREQQCVNLFLRGKTAVQTAEQLGLSARTVEHYFDNIKGKLGISKKLELFELAARQNG